MKAKIGLIEIEGSPIEMGEMLLRIDKKRLESIKELRKRRKESKA